jgi:hypothetical protein
MTAFEIIWVLFEITSLLRKHVRFTMAVLVNSASKTVPHK